MGALIDETELRRQALAGTRLDFRDLGHVEMWALRR